MSQSAEKDASERCGNLNSNPGYPHRCIRKRAHDGKHGYAGVFWGESALAYDDEWCCRPCHLLARALSPLLPGEPEPRVKYLDECVTPPVKP